MGTHRRDVDDAATGSLLFSLDDKGVAAQEDALHIDSHDLLKLVFGHFVGALHAAVIENPRVGKVMEWFTLFV